ncbi:hypothetical protein LCGC14_3039470 [marine sediment metagenome]|uniref:Uncharacterized protein n=1 Tax=marine sediment metagenome TaxID=412755 RepID=A0A0F8WPV4_9ZZZZ
MFQIIAGVMIAFIVFGLILDVVTNETGLKRQEGYRREGAVVEEYGRGKADRVAALKEARHV